MAGQPLNAYAQTQIKTADKGKLLLMLYAAAIREIKQGLAAMDEGNFEQKHEHLSKAQEIIFELRSGLDLESGDLAKNLNNLYAYMIKCLLDGTMKNDPSQLHEVIKHLDELREAWDHALKSPAPKPSLTKEQSPALPSSSIRLSG